MDLNAEFFPREKELDENRKTSAERRFDGRSEQSLSVTLHEFAECRSLGGGVVIGGEPNFADVVGRVGKPRREIRGSPNALYKLRPELNRLHARPAMNLCRRSRPRSSSCIDVA